LVCKILFDLVYFGLFWFGVDEFGLVKRNKYEGGLRHSYPVDFSNLLSVNCENRSKKKKLFENEMFLAS